MGRRHSSLQNNGIPVSTTVPCINLQDTARASPRPCAQCPAIGSIKPGILFAESEYARLHHLASKRLSRLRSSLFQSPALCTRGNQPNPRMLSRISGASFTQYQVPTTPTRGFRASAEVLCLLYVCCILVKYPSTLRSLGITRHPARLATCGQA